MIVPVNQEPRKPSSSELISTAEPGLKKAATVGEEAGFDFEEDLDLEADFDLGFMADLDFEGDFDWDLGAIGYRFRV